MDKSPDRNIEDKQIDLAALTNVVSNLSKSLSEFIFKTIRFVLKHLVVFVVLIAAGIALGMYLDTTKRTYTTTSIVRPNYRSTDYVYSKVDLLYSRIKDKDTVFLKSIGIKNPSKLSNININPVIDIYKFLGENDKKDSDPNLQLFKLLAEDGDLKKIMAERTTSKNYTFHEIKIVTKSRANRDEILVPILKYLDNSDSFKKIQNAYVENVRFKDEANMIMIAQIDALLSTFTNENSEIAKNTKSVYINQNSQMNDLLQTKNMLLNEIMGHKYDFVSNSTVVKEIGSTLNVHDTKELASKLRIIFPIVFVVIYLLLLGLANFYKKQASLYKEE